MNKDREIPLRAPLLYLLLGLISGFVIANNEPAVSPIFPTITGVVLTLLTFFFRSTNYVWLTIFLCACVSTFWSYASIRLSHNSSEIFHDLPPREAKIIIEIERIFKSDGTYTSTSGIANVVKSPSHSRIYPNSLTYFSIQAPKNLEIKIRKGAQLEALGVLSTIKKESVESFNNYLQNTGVYYRFEKSVVLRQIKPPASFALFCERMNDRFLDYLRAGNRKQSTISNIYSAMLLGRKADLDKAQINRYQQTGTMHFFAISGLHVGVIATFLYHLLNLVRIPHNINPWIGLTILYLYVEITGSSSSAVRAFLMVAFFWVSSALSRQPNSLTALINSAILVLLYEPQQLWNIGFQLSYTVVLSILVFGLPLKAILSKRLRPFTWLPKSSWRIRNHLSVWVIDNLILLFSISLSAWLASAPLNAALFGFITPGAILLNMIIINLASLVICTGVLSLVVGILLPIEICAFINNAAWLNLSVIDWFIQLCRGVPGTSLLTEGFSLKASYSILFCYFSVLFYYHHRKERVSKFFCLRVPQNR
ncbi:MAG: ComEC/Rec2 family competence protein [Puniceicoccaceae bacterium]|nr:ComEC/Rec2 family competence protein [Puniceicoccaceae bacterium]